METVTNKTLEKLKYDLVRAGLVPFETLEQAQEIAAAQNINIGQALINSGILTEDALINFLESKLHIPSVNLNDYTLDTNCLKYINITDAKRYKIIPLFKIEDTLTVAMADPLDLFAIDKIVESAECSIEPVISSESSILKKIEEYYKTQAPDKNEYEPINSLIIGVQIDRELRREKISRRLKSRLDEGMVDEVRNILNTGVKPEDLIYYGLEYKFLTQYIIGELVNNNSETRITYDIVDDTVIFKVSVAQGEMGKIIGKNGLTANAIRGVMQAAGVKDKLNVNVEFLD